MDLPLSIAVGSYDVNDALIRGVVTPAGVEPRVFVMPSPERHWRMTHGLEFDICELSLATYLAIRDQASLPIIAIPAFPHRRFRHGYVFVNPRAGIRGPDDLNGRRIGLRTWETTAGLWARGILADDHGLDQATIDWVCQDEEDIGFDLPPGVRVRRAEPGGPTVVEMLLEGALDALIYPEIPEPVRAGDPRISRLFADARAAEVDFFRRTGCFPLMHCVVLRQALVDEHPWLPRAVLDAFAASTAAAFRAMADVRRVSLAWFREAMEAQVEVLGANPWATGVAPNRRPLEMLLRFGHEQGLTRRRLAIAELFAPSVVEDPPAYV